MPFPPSKRVVYKNNALVEVICQLRFSPILKIRRSIPDDLQEKVIGLFPHLEQTETIEFRVGNMGEPPEHVTNRLYKFFSEDRSSNFTLAYDFIALTCQQYTCWENFKEIALTAFSAFSDIYNPASFTRVGLRYRNVIRPSMFDEVHINWIEYVNPSLSGCFSDVNVVKDNIKDYSGKLLIDMGNGDSTLQANYGLVKRHDDNEIGFLIDGDFFTSENVETKGIKNAFTKLDQYKRYSHDFFRWAITDKLHDAMEPQDEGS